MTLTERYEFAILERDEYVAALLSGTLAGLIFASVLLALAPARVRTVGALLAPGAPTLLGLLAWLFLGTALGIGFAPVAALTLDAYLARTMQLTAKSAALRRVLQPLMERSAFATAGAGLGSLYGVVAIALYLVLPPLAAAVTGLAVPLIDAGVLGALLYGPMLGAGYGHVRSAYR
ncbi:hypothetical protein ACFQPA_01055 [Halomarina halobia]|uniref:Uncharacterized protein n=1 Tax=Halomarina halobia TaxID=3033386 RepID=A0ABD6A872_9EURY|nr:hypothetical protein [Halomarina sp. PSR21]